MSLHGAPQPPRSCLDRGTRSPTNDAEVNAMRAAIANGTFQFNAQVVADRMLSNAYEVLSHARA